MPVKIKWLVYILDCKNRETEPSC